MKQRDKPRWLIQMTAVAVAMSALVVLAPPLPRAQAGRSTPVADAGGPYTVAEGATLQLSAADSTDAEGDELTYTWDLDEDGKYDDADGVDPALTWDQLTELGIADDGDPVSVGVRTYDGSSFSLARTTLTVTNTPPAITVVGAPKTRAGRPYILQIDVDDPGDDIVRSWVINWGDGNVETGSGSPRAQSHTYAVSGLTHGVTVQVTDDDGTWLSSELVAAHSDTIDTVGRYDPLTGSRIEEFVSSEAALRSPYGVAVGPDGLVYVTGRSSNTVVRFDPNDSDVVDTFVSARSGGLQGPKGLAFGPDGNLYVASSFTGRVLRYDGRTGVFLDVFAGPDTLNSPSDLLFTIDGSLLVTDSKDDNIERYDGNSGTHLGVFARTGAGSQPEALTVGPEGNVFVALSGSSAIEELDGTSGASVAVFADDGSDSPTALALGPDGHLWVSYYWDEEIRRFDQDTGVALDGGVEQPSPFGPAGIAFTPDLLVTVDGKTTDTPVDDNSTGPSTDKAEDSEDPNDSDGTESGDRTDSGDDTDSEAEGEVGAETDRDNNSGDTEPETNPDATPEIDRDKTETETETDNGEAEIDIGETETETGPADEDRVQTENDKSGSDDVDHVDVPFKLGSKTDRWLTSIGDPSEGVDFATNDGSADSEVNFAIVTEGYDAVIGGGEVALVAEGESVADAVIMDVVGNAPEPKSRLLDESPIATDVDPATEEAALADRGSGPMDFASIPALRPLDRLSLAEADEDDAIEFEEVLDGVDVVYSANGGDVEYSFVIAPGANPDDITLDFDGTERLSVLGSGDLLIEAESGPSYISTAPVTYQEVSGERVLVDSAYLIRPDGTVGFTLGLYNVALPVIIDPTFVTVDTASGSFTSGSTIDVPVPAVVATDDLMVAQIVYNATGGGIITAPAGWTLIDETGGNGITQALYRRIATTSEPSSYSFTLSSGATDTAAGAITLYDDVDTTNPIDAVAAQTNVTAAAVTAPSVTTTVDDTTVVAFFAVRDDGSATPPGGMTGRTDINSDQGGSAADETLAASADETFATAGATGVRTATVDATFGSIGTLVALRPAPQPTQLVMVTGTGDFTGGNDSAKKTLYESFGWTVTALDDDSSAGVFTASAAAADVMFVSDTTRFDIAYSMRELDVPIMIENWSSWNGFMYYGSQPQNWSNQTALDIIVDTHPITSVFPTGTLTIYSASDDLNYWPSDTDPLPAGVTVLADSPVSSVNKAMLVAEAGATLYSANTAVNRRIWLPTDGADPAGYTADYNTLTERSFDWGVAGETEPVSTSVIVNSTGDAVDDNIGDHLCSTGAGNAEGDPECTLRAAIAEANASATVNAIRFNIPASDSGHTSGVWSISPATELPTATSILHIDGTTQPGWSANTINAPGTSFDWNLAIEIDGSATPSGSNGLRLQGDNSSITGISIHDFAWYNVWINDAAGTSLTGSAIGETPSGTAGSRTASDGNIAWHGGSGLLGGTAAADRNRIINSKVRIGGTGTTGTEVSGNVISGADDGIFITTFVSGVDVGAPSDLVIGGTTATSANVISSGALAGVALHSVAGIDDIAILGNSVSGNSGLGIDLNNDGLTNNDAGDGDTGSNGLLNFPALTSASESGGTVTADIDLDVPAGNYRIEFFTNPSGANSSSYGEGEVFVHAASITHGGSGAEPFSTSFSGAIGDVVTATATEDLGGGSYGSTSEFSAASTVTCSTTDSDSDGLFDCYEDANTDADDDPSTSPGPDTDGDSTPNYLDADDDGDGTPTASENADPNADGEPRDARDTDRDGQPDYLDAPSTSAAGPVVDTQKISSTQGGLTGPLDDGDIFGFAVAGIGDLDGDGINDMAVGAGSDDDGVSNAGAVYVLFLNADGTVKAEQKISSTQGGLTGPLNSSDAFGVSVAGIGDIDGDGINDMAVGAFNDDDGGSSRGAVYVLFLNADGTVKAEQKISSTQGSLTGPLDDSDLFGRDVDSIGDLNGDGLNDIIIGASGDDDGGSTRGAVYVLFLNADGTVKAEQKISSTQGSLTGPLDDIDLFGFGVAGIGDIDGDGIEDIAVGATGDDDGSGSAGAVHVLFLNADGTVKGEQKISATQGGFTGPLDGSDFFGTNIAGVGDIDGDGLNDIVVGASADDDGGSGRGAVYLLSLNADGTVKAEQKISDTQGGLAVGLDDGDSLGRAVGAIGDLDGDGPSNLIIGAVGDADGGSDRGAVYVLDLSTLNSLVIANDDSATVIRNRTTAIDVLANDVDANGDAITILEATDAPNGTTSVTGGQVQYTPTTSYTGADSFQYVAADAGTDVTNYWALGGDAIDGVGGQDGVLTGTSTVAGDTGDALSFDESSDRVTFPDVIYGGDLTLSIDFKLDDNTGSLFQYLYSHGDINTTNSVNIFFNEATHGTDPNVLRTVVRDGDDSLDNTALEFDISSIVGDGQWHTYTLNADSSGGLTVWLDGIVQATDSTRGTGTIDPTGSLYLGARQDLAADRFYGGLVDTMQLIDGSPAQSEMADREAKVNHATVNVTVVPCTDSDSDGLCNIDEDANTDADDDPSTSPGPDTDGDTTPNYLDADDDGDGTPTASENADPNADGDPRDAIDSDRDGQPDYLDAPTKATLAAVDSEQKISSTQGGLTGPLDNFDLLGSGAASVGDLDGDGIVDLAVGAYQDDDGGSARGAVYVLFLNADGTVKAEQKISDTQGGLAGILNDSDQFGRHVAALGDLDGDGLGDIAVGAFRDDDGGTNRGAVYVLFLNADGTVKAEQKISSTEGGLSTLGDSDEFGRDVAGLGDIDGDGIVDLAVGAYQDDDGGSNRGAVYVLLLNADGTVKAEQKISDTTGGLTATLDNGDEFGLGLAGLGDLDADGVNDIAVGAPDDDDGGSDAGAVYVLFLNADGTVKAEQKISASAGGLGASLDVSDFFGGAISSLGDLDLDGAVDLAVGATGDDDGASSAGAVHLLFLNTDGTVKTETKLSSTSGDLNGPLDSFDSFGSDVAGLGDLDGDGTIHLAVGAQADDDGASGAGAIYIIELALDTTVTVNSTGDAADNNLGDDTCDTGATNAEGDPECTLRAAIAEANASSQINTIDFNIPASDANHTSGVWTITPATVLPPATSAVTIDGTTQAGTTAATNIFPDPVDSTLTVELSGSVLSAGTDHLIRLDSGSSGSEIRGLAFNGLTPVNSNSVLIIDSSNNVVAGNHFGSDAAGLVVDSTYIGAYVDGTSAGNRIGSATAADRNLFVGLTYSAVVMARSGATGTVVQGNDVGYYSGGADAPESATFGVVAFDGSAGSRIGGTGAGEGNRIRGVANGVLVDANTAAASATILGNHISDTTVAGIDLGNDGSTVNDAGDGDAGPNNLLNHPVITNVGESGGTLTVDFDLDVPAGDYRIEFFTNPSGAGAGSYGNGEIFSHAEAITHTGSGGESFSASFTGLTTDIVTATATQDLGGGSYGPSSEFSLAWFPELPIVVNSTGDDVDADPGNGLCDTGATNIEGDQECTLRAAIAETNSAAQIDEIDFLIPASDPGHVYYQDNATSGFGSPMATTLDDASITDFDADYPASAFSWWQIDPATDLPAISAPVTIDGYTQPGAQANTVAGNGTLDAVLRIEIDHPTTRTYGLQLSGGGSTVRGLAIDEGSNAILIDSAGGNTITGNWLGADVTGASSGSSSNDIGVFLVTGSDSNTIGGSAPADVNLIAHNSSIGIDLNSDGNQILGNRIGFDLLGDTVTLNSIQDTGILVDGSNNQIGSVGAGNLIGRNIDSGLWAWSGTSNTIQANTFLANSDTAVTFAGSSSNLVGGAGPGEGNTITGTISSPAIGVSVGSGADNAILGNNIHSNDGLGIDLGANYGDGVTANDAGDSDTGANDLLNFAIVTSAAVSGGTVSVDLDLDAPAGDYRIELFVNPSGADPSGHGEGESLANAFTVTHTGSGSESFSTSYAGSGGVSLTATATEDLGGGSYGSTSEFSASFVTCADPDGDGLCSHHENLYGDTDGDTTANEDDSDDDGDGIPTASENADPNGDGNPRDALDVDRDGQPDWLDVSTVAAESIVASEQKISDTQGGLAVTLDDSDEFGRAVTAIGDLDGDGINDIAAGLWSDDDGGTNRGAVQILFLNADGTVKAEQKISDADGGLTAALDDSDAFGHGLAVIGDLDGDGINDLAVGAQRDDDGGTDRGAVYILFLNTDGTVKAEQKISDTAGGLTASLDDDDLFGHDIGTIGDLDGDGIPDLAVTTHLDDDGGTNRGAVYIVFLNTDGTVKAEQKISDTAGGLTTALADNDRLGMSISGLGDVDGDGTLDLIVGASTDDDGGNNRGAVHVLFLNTDGTVKAEQEISGSAGGFPDTINNWDEFGYGVAGIGDLDGDGVADAAIGSRFNDTGGTNHGSLWLVALNNDGTVKDAQVVSDGHGGFVGPLDDDGFGSALAGLGDLDGDGTIGLVVGAPSDDDGGTDRGAVYILDLDATSVATVNSTGDGTDTNPGDGVCDTGGSNADGDPECTLRAAIAEANASAALDTINFFIPATDANHSGGVWTISPASALDNITAAADIDASTQPGWTSSPVIVLDGSGAGSGDGFWLGASGSTVRGFAIVGFPQDGIDLDGTGGHTVAGNYIGLLADGTTVSGNGSDGILVTGGSDGNPIGGPLATDRNVVAGSGTDGIDAYGADVVIENNYIGTDATGLLSRPNGDDGIDLDPADRARVDGNVISGDDFGIVARDTADVVIVGNSIGVGSDGTTALGNNAGGILMLNIANGGIIGGVGAGNGNVIANNGGHAIEHRSTGDISILGNSMFANDSLGIDLDGDGVTANDAGDGDSGANGLLNYPVLTEMTEAAGTLTVDFDLDVPAGDYRIEFFTNPSGPDPSGHGEGEVFTHAETITHTGSGVEAFSASFTATKADVVAATTTEDLGGGNYGATSEFSGSASIIIVVNSTGDAADTTPGDGVCNTGGTNADGDPECTLRAAIAEGNASAVADEIEFAIPTGDTNYVAGSPSYWIISPATTQLGPIQVDRLDATTQPGWSDQPIIQLSGASLSGSEDGINADQANMEIRGLSITGWPDDGAHTQRDGVEFAGNWLGIDPTGTTVANQSSDLVIWGGAAGVTVGGPTVADGNVFAAAGTADGIELSQSATGTTIVNNRFGIGADGTADLGPTGEAIVISEAINTTIDDNVFGNFPNAAIIQSNGSNGTIITGNSFGLDDISGAAPTSQALWTNGSGTVTFGGIGVGDGNTVRNASDAAVSVDPSATGTVTILGNSIAESSNIGIDLNSDFVTINDAGDVDAGPNGLLNFPVITAADESAGTVSVGLDLDAPAGIYRVELFTNPSGANPSGYGEGQNLVHTFAITHTGSGSESFSTSYAGAAGLPLTATATEDLGGNNFGATSEFSTAIDTCNDQDGDGLCSHHETPFGDTDGDTTPNENDADDDGDSTPTASENADQNGDGDPRDANDSDWDGQPDYLDTEAGPSTAPIDNEQKISDTTGGLVTALDDIDGFGTDVTSLGDIDGDGIADVAVGAPYDDDGGSSRGAVYVLFLNADGTVRAEQKISSGTGGLTTALTDWDQFGMSVAGLGDLDGDGTPDIAIGATYDDDGGTNRGAVHVLFLNGDGTVRAEQKISSGNGRLAAALADWDQFGSSATGLGDVDGDGIPDLAVGAPSDDDGAVDSGAVYILLLRPDGTVKAEQKISNVSGGLTATLDATDYFGSGLAVIGDLDRDGTADLAVGAELDDDGGTDRGAVHVLFLNADGTVKAEQKISATTGGLNGPLSDSHRFGVAVSGVGDIDGDSIVDLAVGAVGDGSAGQGATYLLGLNVDGTVKVDQKISSTIGGLTGPLDDNDNFGQSVAGLGDLDGDGTVNLIVGAASDDDGGPDRGAVYVLDLSPIVPTITVNSTGDSGDVSPGNGACDTGGFNADSAHECTLRAAIEEANASSIVDTIEFAIPATDSGQSGGVWTLTPATAYPAINLAVVIDGSTQPGFLANTNPSPLALNGTQVLVIDGSSVPTGGDGLQIQAADVEIRGFVIGGFNTLGGYGI